MVLEAYQVETLAGEELPPVTPVAPVTGVTQEVSDLVVNSVAQALATQGVNPLPIVRAIYDDASANIPATLSNTITMPGTPVIIEFGANITFSNAGSMTLAIKINTTTIKTVTIYGGSALGTRNLPVFFKLSASGITSGAATVSMVATNVSNATSLSQRYLGVYDASQDLQVLTGLTFNFRT